VEKEEILVKRNIFFIVIQPVTQTQFKLKYFFDVITGMHFDTSNTKTCRGLRGARSSLYLPQLIFAQENFQQFAGSFQILMYAKGDMRF
jgi:hypothetical protein